VNVPREERTRAFVWDPISGLHQGQQPQRLHSKAEYMAAPERFAEMPDFSLAPRAPSIHGTSLRSPRCTNLVAIRALRTLVGAGTEWYAVIDHESDYRMIRRAEKLSNGKVRDQTG